MNFNQIILKKLGSIFNKYNLHLLEQRDNYLKLVSDKITIILVHNQLENSNTFWLGENDEKIDKVEINNKILKLFFNSRLKLSEVPVDVFANNLALFSENEGKALFMGDLYMLNELKEFDSEKNRKYTKDLVSKQYLAAADIAWDKNDYHEFISLINKINHDNLQLSYQLKYKIANQKLKK